MSQVVPAESPAREGERSAPPRSAAARRRVGLLGAGYIADWHAKALASVNGVELVAVCDQVATRARAFAERFGVASVHGSLERMLEEEELEAVHVLLPPDLHFRAARAILEAGVHVFVEKPMCDRPEDCDSLVRLAEAKGLRLGVGHNFLFSDCYEPLRQAVRDGVLGPIDHVSITWHRELPQARRGPFDIWMLREPGNVMLEIGSHAVASVLDLVGRPDDVRTRLGNPLDLPTGQKFYRRWLIDVQKGTTAVDLRLSFVPGFAEYAIHVRGSLGAATVDFERNTFVLQRHRPQDEDFERYAMVCEQARSLRTQARRTLRGYALSKLHLHRRGSPYGGSIAKAMDAFYGGLGRSLDARISGEMGAEVIRICEQARRAAGLARASTAPGRHAIDGPGRIEPRILVLGATGFIGQELVRQLVQAGHDVRLLVRSPSKLPADLGSTRVEWVQGDLASDVDLRRAMAGIGCVYHLARANVKTWTDYQRYEIEVTRQIAEHALAAGVRRFVYTGTIDSYYAGVRAGTITEQTPLDPRIERRNLYARAKAASERMLLRMYRERGLPLVIFRPGIVIGRGGSPFHWGVGMWWHDSVCQIWGSGRNKLPLVLVEDVGRALVKALDVPGIEGESFNLVGDPCLSAQEYLDELDRCGGFKLRRSATPIVKFFLLDLFKWSVKVLVRHPERRLPSYHDWESRTQRAVFDCTRAKARLGWKPAGGREELVERGIREPLVDYLR